MNLSNNVASTSIIFITKSANHFITKSVNHFIMEIKRSPYTTSPDNRYSNKSVIHERAARAHLIRDTPYSSKARAWHTSCYCSLARARARASRGNRPITFLIQLNIPTNGEEAHSCILEKCVFTFRSEIHAMLSACRVARFLRPWNSRVSSHAGLFYNG